MSPSDARTFTTPLPRRFPPAATASPPDITPRRLALPRDASSRPCARSAPRRLVSSRLAAFHNAVCDEGECNEDLHIVRTELSPTDRISRTPARAENDSWLEQFGIDISLLRIYDSDDEQNAAQHQHNDENEHPNLTPSRLNSALKSPCALKSSVKCEAFELCSTFGSPAATASLLPERHTQSPEQHNANHQPITPRRLHSSRSRRQSVKISQRELISLTQVTSVESVTHPPLQVKPEPKEFSSADLSSSNAITGSNVFLTPVRASRKQRLHLGADTVVTPVRRSLRLNGKQQNLAPMDQPQARARMLEQFGFTYTPNHSLQ